MSVAIRRMIYESLFYSDQFLREKIIKTKSMLFRKVLWYIIKTLDIFNQKIVFYLIDRYGWPLICEYGVKANMTAFYIVMHSEKKGLEKYYPVLKQATIVEKENCYNLSCVLDRLLLYKKRKQLFGNEARGLRNEIGELKYYIYPITDFAHINQRRAKIGLNGIEEYAAENNCILHYDDDIYQRLMNYPNG